ncbi:aldo/keto reductase [Scleromatobacter humisilvae]|uniref:Aldo/keto reductase n=1 Tax=Scleromatobacter humisilvae TaxID=2897159 RepID=A0A9X1YQT4_9BURK|nr:aldo/keto reductase [Scleromatobacter humisilvae]MCK9689653.1 aldo/keto reductase [Scleromatobacter humisilvae]
MQLRPLGQTGLQIAPIVFGGNVFGWTADENRSFELLDAFVDAGFNAIDTADVYSRWVPGHQGGESETLIGRWLKANPARRRQVLLFTKVGSDMGDEHKGLGKLWIERAVEDSLRRLNTDVIDLYQSHRPDPETSYEETLATYDRLMKAGKIRAFGCSNFDARQLAEAQDSARINKLPAYQTLQPEYNLHDRDAYDGPLRDLAIKLGLGVITYFSLASGFLTGKYRSEADLGKSQRGGGVKKYLNPRGRRILGALDQVSQRHGTKPGVVALAWLIAREGVTAPIASATSVEQLKDFSAAAELALSDSDRAQLDQASAPDAA